MIYKKFDITWSGFALIEFLVSAKNKIGKEYKTVLDIGSGQGTHSQLLKYIGLDVYQVDKYSNNAEYKVDFISHKFNKKFDVIFCSHVIEHQRNVGLFLDKIFDLMHDNSILIITVPNHPVETIIEGHLNSFIFPCFLQHMIHAGFDCRNGKFISISRIENSFIVKKDKNFDLKEREEQGYIWTQKHQNRSFYELKNSTIDNNKTYVYNCEILEHTNNSLLFNSIKNIEINVKTNNKPSKQYGIEINMGRWGISIKI
jgi:2-polyprenyl-3-methyl-5-hydroxy-6-metoxy-1,4-benzoquinol methylase